MWGMTESETRHNHSVGATGARKGRMGVFLQISRSRKPRRIVISPHTTAIVYTYTFISPVRVRVWLGGSKKLTNENLG